MPTADLRALAERLRMLKSCGCVSGCERCVEMSQDIPMTHYRRLPTEAEVRAAIREAGVRNVIAYAGKEDVAVRTHVTGKLDRTTSAHISEAGPEDLVLLALLRALEVCRG